MTVPEGLNADLPGLQPDVPSVARIYDYMLGGNHNFASDRAAAEAMMGEFPALPQLLRSVRAFVRRATSFLAAEGIDQFLDLGSGIPTVQNVHEVAQAANPAARVAYVDIDPIAVVHSRSILQNRAGTTAIQGDLRRPETVYGNPEILKVIDFTRPVGVIMSAVLHFIADDNEALRIVDAYMNAVPPGSYLVIVHHTGEGDREDEARARAIYSSRAQPLIPRSREQIARFFHGLDLVEPGIVLTPQWRPGPEDALDTGPGEVPLYFGGAGVGRKPA